MGAKNDFDKQLLYAIHHKEQYDLDEHQFKEYSEFLQLRQLLADSHEEVLADELLRNQEEELEDRFNQQQVELEVKQFEQWKYYHGIEDPELIRNPELLFGHQISEKEPEADSQKGSIHETNGQCENSNPEIIESENEHQERDANLKTSSTALEQFPTEINPDTEIDTKHVGKVNPDHSILTNQKSAGATQNDLSSHKELKAQPSKARQDYYSKRSQERQNVILEELHKLKDSQEKQPKNSKEHER